jgi:hypothetical protein
MAIFNSYVSLPEGSYIFFGDGISSINMETVHGDLTKTSSDMALVGSPLYVGYSQKLNMAMEHSWRSKYMI